MMDRLVHPSVASVERTVPTYREASCPGSMSSSNLQPCPHLSGQEEASLIPAAKGAQIGTPAGIRDQPTPHPGPQMLSKHILSGGLD